MAPRSRLRRVRRRRQSRSGWIADLEARLRAGRTHFTPCLGLAWMLARVEWEAAGEGEATAAWQSTTSPRSARGRMRTKLVLPRLAERREHAVQEVRMPRDVTTDRVFVHANYYLEMQGRPIPVRTPNAWSFQGGGDHFPMSNIRLLVSSAGRRPSAGAALAQHLDEVDRIAEPILARHPAGAFATAGFDARAVLRALAGWHDLGKGTAFFQDYIADPDAFNARARAGDPGPNPTLKDHTPIGAFLAVEALGRGNSPGVNRWAATLDCSAC